MLKGVLVSLCLTSCVVARRHRLIALIGRMFSKSFGICAVWRFMWFLVLDEDFTHQLLRTGQRDAWLQLKPTLKKTKLQLITKTNMQSGWFVLTGYLSRGSINRASPNIDRQYSAILACCFKLRHTYSGGMMYSDWINRDMHWQENNRGNAHESTWFSKDRMTGKGEVLKAHSAMASTTSWKISNITWHQGESSANDIYILTSFSLSTVKSHGSEKTPNVLEDIVWMKTLKRPNSVNITLMSFKRLSAASFHTLKEISDVMVNPCVMTGSSSVVRPFQTSNSTQRQPARRTCLYISTEELPASWPAATTRGRDTTSTQRLFSYVCLLSWTGHSFFILQSNHFTRWGARMVPTVGLLAAAFTEPACVPVRYVLCDELMK